TRVYLAMSCYRAGKFSEALEQLDLYERSAIFGVEADEGHFGFAQVIRAMLAQRQGHTTEAKKHLQRARDMQSFLGMRFVANALDNTGWWLWGWAQLRISLMEAQALIDGSGPARNPWNLILEARAAAQYGLAEKARAILADPLVRQPTDPALLAARAQVLL